MIGEAFLRALTLIVAGDKELFAISLRSLQVSLSAVFLACALGFPLGAWLAVNRFRYRRFAVGFLNALMALPPVVVGLLTYLLFSRSGPLGVLGLLYTPWAMIIAQTIIVLPIVASIAHQATRDLWADYHDLLLSLGARRRQRMVTLIWDSRRALLTAALAGFGRAIGEVGAVMIVGGNIDQLTRVLTTAIALETARGELALALALGIVLMLLALGVNLLFHLVARTESSRRW